VEVKLIIYIVGGIIYFVYTMMKKANAQKNAIPPLPNTTGPDTSTQSRPIKPPASNPLEEVMAEIRRKQALAEAQKRTVSTQQAKPQPTFQKSTPKDIFIHEKKKATFGEGANDAPVYEREVLPSEKIVRGDIKLKNEGIYRVETMEEARALADNTETSTYDFDAKQAFIGSLIFERKF
jgi:hypothetical protein